MQACSEYLQKSFHFRIHVRAKKDRPRIPEEPQPAEGVCPAISVLLTVSFTVYSTRGTAFPSLFTKEIPCAFMSASATFIMMAHSIRLRKSLQPYS